MANFPMWRMLAAAALVSTAAVAAEEHSLVDNEDSMFGSPEHFTEQGGEKIYRHVCAGCHMPDAAGAVGAGRYPALAANPKLEAGGYPIAMILHGQKAMPSLGEYLNDQQVAEVVNYVRTHFGNHYRDAVSEADVKAAR